MILFYAADPQRPAGRPTLFGNQVLSRFNFILNNRTSTLYLKPNGRTNVLYSDYDSFQSLLEYAGATVVCEVVMRPVGYDILFDGRWMASVADWTWIQDAGVILPEEVIDEIGARIESEYR